MAEVKREHREAAATLIPFVASAWVDDPTHTYGLAAPELSVLTKAAEVLAEAEQRGYARGLADGAERERARIVRYIRDDGFYPSMIEDIESGKHLAGESE